MIGLLLVSVGVAIFGWAKNFDDLSVDLLFYWAYVMVAVALIGIVFIGGWISIKNDKKFLVKALCVLGGVAVICVAVYLLSPGAPAIGIADQPSASVLKLTDTVINLTIVAGVVAILSIVVGEVYNAIRNKREAK